MKGEVKLMRTDKRPLVFIGEEIFDGSTKGPDSTRWKVVRVFLTNGGYVVGVANLTCWDGERDNYVATKKKSVEDTLSFIQKNAPELHDRVKDAVSMAGSPGG